MSSESTTVAVAAGFGSPEAPQIPGAIPAVARVALNAKNAVKIDLRSAASITAKFAPFERVTLLWASATLHLVPADTVTVACGWVPNTATLTDALVEHAFDGCELSTAKYAGVTAVVPLSEPNFGTELKALVSGNPSPAFAAVATGAVGFIKVKLLFSGSGVAIA